MEAFLATKKWDKLIADKSPGDTPKDTQKRLSQLERNNIEQLKGVRRCHPLPLFREETAWVREVMGGTERVRAVEEAWRVAHGDDFWPHYNSEGELETLLEKEFNTLLRGLPREVPAGMYPEEEVEGVRRVINARANYSGRASGQIKFDIALMIGRRFPDRGPKEDVFGFVEVKTEANLEMKEEGIEEALRQGNVQRSRVDKMSPSERLLVQVSE